MASTESEPRDESSSTRDSKFAALKKLLLADEQSVISDLQRRIAGMEEEQALIDALRSRVSELEELSISRAEFERRLAETTMDAERLSELLPVAVETSSAKGESLSQSLSPTLTTAFHESVQRNPQALADAVAPIMGPAIRRSISQAITAMLQSLNQTLENSFSARGLSWRWEALTTGKSFAEVVLLHSLIYQVEHVFLIHRKDGILLRHVDSVSGGSVGGDADLVSGMLTALQDFVRDSFGGEPSDELEDLRVGDRNVFVEHGSDAILAAVIRGHPPESLRTTLQETIETFHQKYNDQIAQFNGETTRFEPFEPKLRECLQSAYREDTRRKTTAQKWMGRLRLVVAGATLLTLITWAGLRIHHASQLAEIRQLLAVPQSVAMDLQEGILRLSGEAHDDWIARTLATAAALDGIDQVDARDLVNLDESWLRFLAGLREQPGIVVTSAIRDGAVYRLDGLRDPLAVDPNEIITQHGFQDGQVIAHFTPYHSIDANFVVARTQKLLGDEAGLSWNFDQGLLTVAGSASDQWHRTADRVSGQLEGIRLDFSQVINTDREFLKSSAESIRNSQITFEEGSAQLAEGQSEELDAVAESLSLFFARADQIGQPVRVIVVGYADQKESTNSAPQTLSEARARFVWKELTSRAVSPERLLIRSLGASRPIGLKPEEMPPDMRRTLFDVKLGGDL